MALLLVAGKAVIAEEAEHCGNALVGGNIIGDELVGAWVVNATTLVATGTTETEVTGFGNLNFMIDGNYVSHFSMDIQQGIPEVSPYGNYATAGSGVWHKAGHHRYKGVDVREQLLKDLTSGENYVGLPNARVKQEVRIQLSKCGNFFKGTMIATFYPIDELAFKHALPLPPVTWQLNGARVQSK